MGTGRWPLAWAAVAAAAPLVATLLVAYFVLYRLNFEFEP